MMINGSDSDSALFPLKLSLSLDGDLTRMSEGPASSVYFPLLALNLPCSYLVIMVLDFLAAMAVERSFFAECQAPVLFESAWQGSGQLGGFGPARPAHREAEEAAAAEEPASSRQDDPLYAPGIAVSLFLETPFRTCRGEEESAAGFVYQLVDFPRLPSWMLPVAALIIYGVAHLTAMRQ